MSTLWLPRTLTEQPDYAAPVNEKSPLSQGLIMLIGMCGNQLQDAITGTIFQHDSSTLAPWTTESSGKTLNWTSAGASYYAPRLPSWEPASAVSWLVYARAASTQNSYARPFGKTYNNGSAAPYMSYDIEYWPASTANTVNVQVALPGGNIGVKFTDPNVLLPHIIVGTYSTVSGLAVYMNGKLIGTVAANGNIIYDMSASGNMIISGSSSLTPANQFNGGIFCIAAWNRVLSAAEVAAVSQI